MIEKGRRLGFKTDSFLAAETVVDPFSFVGEESRLYKTVVSALALVRAHVFRTEGGPLIRLVDIFRNKKPSN